MSTPINPPRQFPVLPLTPPGELRPGLRENKAAVVEQGLRSLSKPPLPKRGAARTGAPVRAFCRRLRAIPRQPNGVRGSTLLFGPLASGEPSVSSAIPSSGITAPVVLKLKMLIPMPLLIDDAGIHKSLASLLLNIPDVQIGARPIPPAHLPRSTLSARSAIQHSYNIAATFAGSSCECLKAAGLPQRTSNLLWSTSWHARLSTQSLFLL